MKNLINVKLLFKKEKFKRIFWENIVVYDEWYFYKTLNRLWKIMHPRKNRFNNIKNNIDIIKEYFWNICEIADTEIIPDEEYLYIIRQQKINWNILKISNLKNKEIKESFIKIMNINIKLWKEKWYFLDIFWTDVLLNFFYIHNLMLYNWNIYIFDFWLLNRNSTNPFFRFVSLCFYYIQILFFKLIIKFL